MENIGYVVFYSLVGGLVSLIGGIALLSNKRLASKLISYGAPFAGGALLAAAFTDVLPEAMHGETPEQALRWTMIGIILFFLLERFVHWQHARSTNEKRLDATVPLIVIGDTIHNFIDGIAIAAAFLIDVPTGIITTLAVAAHEIPQEIGDFGLLLSKGMSRKGVIKVNVISSLATAIAAVLFFMIGQATAVPLDIVLGIVAGFFIYIAVSDILPMLHKQEGKRLMGAGTTMLILGALVISAVTTSLHGVIESEAQHKTEASQQYYEEE
jgi:zinc and cadmium transporter